MPSSRPNHPIDDVQAFFDDFASENTDRHGDPDQLLAYRVKLLDSYADFRPDDVVLDLGCGDGNHLRAIAPKIERGVGVDIAPRMVESAASQSSFDNLTFYVDDARRLSKIGADAVDVVICVGALEHMIDQEAALQNVSRVLRPGGRFVCLTLNGGYTWYQTVAPALGYQTKHLATDRRLTAAEAESYLQDAGFHAISVDYWTFVPRGDMSTLLARIFDGLDVLGRWTGLSSLRGGLVLSAQHPPAESKS